MDKTTNAVRQVLMNEMGLTRESVRDQVDSIVRDAVRKHIAGPQFTNLIEREIKATIEAALKEQYYDRDKLKAHVITAIKQQVADAVAASLELTVKSKP